jgi:hypothetical protein
MTISTKTNSLAQLLDGATPNNGFTFLQQLGLGRMVRQMMPATLRGQVPLIGVANPYQLSTLDSIALPDDAKASQILRTTVIAGGTTGEFSIKGVVGTTPTTGTVAIAPNGDIVFVHTTDLVTLVDIVYIPEKQDAYEFPSLVPASGVVTLPTSINGLSAATGGTYAGRASLAVSLMEAEILTGTATGKCVVLVPGGAPGTTLQANLSVDKTKVNFHVADAPTAVRLKLGLVSVIDQNALLEAAGTVF